ncbi:MAG: hypothetical protein ABR552_00245 [Actinomycetota bacterium]
MRSKTMMAILALALAAVGCSSGSVSPRPSASLISSTGQIKITSPVQGATVKGPRVTIIV